MHLEKPKGQHIETGESTANQIICLSSSASSQNALYITLHCSSLYLISAQYRPQCILVRELILTTNFVVDHSSEFKVEHVLVYEVSRQGEVSC
jgi:hypothetical protein